MSVCYYVRAGVTQGAELSTIFFSEGRDECHGCGFGFNLGSSRKMAKLENRIKIEKDPLTLSYKMMPRND